MVGQALAAAKELQGDHVSFELDGPGEQAFSAFVVDQREVPESNAGGLHTGHVAHDGLQPGAAGQGMAQQAFSG